MPSVHYTSHLSRFFPGLENGREYEAATVAKLLHNIDADYDVALCIGFESAADYATYVEHPDHVAFVTEWKPSFMWIRIHDVVDETP